MYLTLDIVPRCLVCRQSFKSNAALMSHKLYSKKHHTLLKTAPAPHGHKEPPKPVPGQTKLMFKAKKEAAIDVEMAAVPYDQLPSVVANIVSWQVTCQPILCITSHYITLHHIQHSFAYHCREQTST